MAAGAGGAGARGGVGGGVAWARVFAGRLIVFEGPDGSGKSTQASRLRELMIASGVTVCTVREPGGTSTGEAIRKVLLDKEHTGMTVRCEMLLYMASRAELIEQVIAPALRRGEVVLADRYVGSTLAYQGAAGGLPYADIAAVARVATRGIMPEVVLLYDIDETAAAKRLTGSLDRMEAKGAEFHRKVREGYLDQARSDPRRFVVLDASKDQETVWTATQAALRERAERLSAGG